MEREHGYSESNVNPYTASQRQPVSDQRMQQTAVANNFTGRVEEEQRQYVSRKEEGQWQWERDTQQMSPQLYSDGQGGYASKSFYSTPLPDIKLGTNQEPRVPSQEQDMEVGYEDNPAPQNLEGLEQKFREDITKLTNEQVDKEDLENARHREKILEITNQYQEKLTALRARYATRRENVFQKESQARLHEYQLSGLGTFPNNTAPTDINHGRHGYGEASRSGEPQREYGGKLDSFRHTESLERGRIQGGDTRVPAPGGGRVYNTGSRYY